MLKEHYQNNVVPALREQLKLKNVMEVPRLVKIVVNIGVGEAIANAKALEAAQKDLETITGQKPIVTRSKKSIAAFKQRKGMPIGLKVTMRGKRMYDKVDKTRGMEISIVTTARTQEEGLRFLELLGVPFIRG